MAYTSRYTLLPSTPRTAAGASGWQTMYHEDELLAFLNVTAASGTSPTLDVKIQVKDPDGEIYDLANGAFAQKTGAGKEAKGIEKFGEDVRVSWAMGGTSPSFTFGVTAIGKARN